MMSRIQREGDREGGERKKRDIEKSQREKIEREREIKGRWRGKGDRYGRKQ